MRGAACIARVSMAWLAIVAAAELLAQEAEFPSGSGSEYAADDWKRAVGENEALVAGGAVDAAVYYNLGTAYARTGESGRALWMLLRARRLAPRDRDVLANLDLLVDGLAPNLYSQIAIFPLAPLQMIYDRLTLNEWALVAGSASALAVVAWVLVFSIPRGARARRPIRRLAIGAVVLALAGHHFAAFKYYDERYTSRGIVVVDGAYPRAWPGTTAPMYESALPSGTVFRVGYAGVQGWVKAIYGGNNEVFILREQMEYL